MRHFSSNNSTSHMCQFSSRSSRGGYATHMCQFSSSGRGASPDKVPI
ncbi:MAG TPA: hypothetical protein PLI57_01625 [Spirochaetota bacterium]|nr:hypothetical protein [Spirochaetota bacterium]